MTTADRVSEILGDDGQHWTGPDGERIESICERLGGRCERCETKTDVVRWAFADGSVITIAGDGWDHGYTGCWCWQGAGHTEHCEIEIAREEFERACGGRRAAVEYEQAVLSCGDEFLPEYVRAVATGGTRTAPYWRYLTEQVDAKNIASEMEA
jgi:hypothetical protein